MSLGVNRDKKSFLSFIILVHVGILYTGKFFLTAESWETTAVVITRVLCSLFAAVTLIDFVFYSIFVIHASAYIFRNKT